jgi:hypothetical protein
VDPRLDFARLFLQKTKEQIERIPAFKFKTPLLGEDININTGLIHTGRVLSEPLKTSKNGCLEEQLCVSVNYNSDHGDSGSPVWNTDGHCVGIHRAGDPRGIKNPQNYAIPVNNHFCEVVSGMNVRQLADFMSKNL